MPRRKLPPDPDRQNDDRSEWAAVALKAFQAETGTEDEDVLADLLTDLIHWADRHNRDFAQECDLARSRYRDETDAKGGW
jgi:hypothetical protein